MCLLPHRHRTPSVQRHSCMCRQPSALSRSKLPLSSFLVPFFCDCQKIPLVRSGTSIFSGCVHIPAPYCPRSVFAYYVDPRWRIFHSHTGVFALELSPSLFATLCLVARSHSLSVRSSISLSHVPQLTRQGVTPSLICRSLNFVANSFATVWCPYVCNIVYISFCRFIYANHHFLCRSGVTGIVYVCLESIDGQV